MIRNTKVDDALTEWVIEECWQISCRFMKEIERECDCQGKLPVNLLMASENLVIKWIEFAGKN